MVSKLYIVTHSWTSSELVQSPAKSALPSSNYLNRTKPTPSTPLAAARSASVTWWKTKSSSYLEIPLKTTNSSLSSWPKNKTTT